MNQNKLYRLTLVYINPLVSTTDLVHRQLSKKFELQILNLISKKRVRKTKMIVNIYIKDIWAVFHFLVLFNAYLMNRQLEFWKEIVLWSIAELQILNGLYLLDKTRLYVLNIKRSTLWHFWSIFAPFKLSKSHDVE